MNCFELFWTLFEHCFDHHIQTNVCIPPSIIPPISPLPNQNNHNFLKSSPSSTNTNTSNQVTKKPKKSKNMYSIIDFNSCKRSSISPKSTEEGKPSIMKMLKLVPPKKADKPLKRLGGGFGGRNSTKSLVPTTSRGFGGRNSAKSLVPITSRIQPKIRDIFYRKPDIPGGILFYGSLNLVRTIGSGDIKENERLSGVTTESKESTCTGAKTRQGH